MRLSLVTPPATEPITIAEAKAHLRLDSSSGEPTPTAPTVALAGAGAGNVENGAHRYRVTLVTAAGETDGGVVSAAVTVVDKTTNGKVTVSAIPLGGSAVTQRKLYRTTAGGSTYLLLDTIPDNVTVQYLDNTADASLGAAAPTTNTTADPIVTSLIKASREYVEEYTGRALITQTWDAKFDRFPCGGIIVPRPPLQTVTSVTYLDSAGASQTWANTEYTVSAPAGGGSEPGRINIDYGSVYPVTLRQPDAITVRFVAGYGAASAVPETLKAAQKLMLGHLYEHREAVATGTQGYQAVELPLAVAAILGPYEAWRFQ